MKLHFSLNCNEFKIFLKKDLISVAEPFLFGPGPAPGIFSTDNGSFSYKTRNFFSLHIFKPAPAPTKKYWLQLRNT